MEGLYKNKKVAVLGLEMEGRELVRFLLSQGVDVTVFDQKEEKDLNFEEIDKGKINLICGENYLSQGLLGFHTIFRSPGFYRYLPEIVDAEKCGVEISSAIKLFFDLCLGKIIGVTGTKGKGTTATLIYKILKSAGKDVYLAGNIGKPFLELLPKLNKDSWVVLELSSFQLIDLTKSPHIAVVLNITTDHLDWHKDRKEYVDAKKNIVKYQGENDFAVLNYDYKDSKSFEKLTKAEVYYFSRKGKVRGSCVDKGRSLQFARTVLAREIGDVKELKLRGKHNWENVTAAICASHLAGADIKSIKKVVFSFKGLEHRLELVDQPLKGNPCKVRGISFYNDSFSTNPQTTTAAINSFDEPITLILGGFDKGLEYDGLAREIKKRKNVEVIILIGDIAPQIKKALKKVKFAGKVFDLGKSSMKKIVKTAFENTQK
ncbi:UDP-N-acetylmuramoyl-L-alanine--D-glutamate ligase, partial [Patescibacteria group bacterium]|nr:UDP-N-acetylmuramoyl-L-alanine--D-glutamate ligase [Patescibacteria group bacterium]